MEKNNYDIFGYTEFRKFLSKEKLDFLNSTIDSIKLPEGKLYEDSIFDEDGTGKIKQIQYLHKLSPVFKELLDEITPYAQYLTGYQQLDVLNMQLFEKHAEISKPTRAHQDNAYFKVSPAHAITFWIALDDIDEQNGCIYYAPKTHLTPTRKHQRYHKDTTFRVRSGVPGLSLCLHEHPEETDIPMVTKAGDVLAHHCNLVHRAGRNLSERRRRAIGIAFIPTVCKIDERLNGYHLAQLKEDIELQQIKDPEMYRKLKKEYTYLF